MNTLGDFDGDEFADSLVLGDLAKMREELDNELSDPETNRLNRNHPERQEDEIFYSNADDKEANEFHIPFDEMDFQTKRKGITSYSSRGEPLDDLAWKDSFPVFVKKTEALEKLGAEKFQRMLPDEA